ncbi:MAG: hypothetical protein KJ729_01930 [Euryarchaeota archaeon]|nr:hypothetical protein [Euryarchaeota archaeon]
MIKVVRIDCQVVHLLFRAVVYDTWELRTMLRSIALPVIFTQEQTCAEGF